MMAAWKKGIIFFRRVSYMPVSISHCSLQALDNLIFCLGWKKVLARGGGGHFRSNFSSARSSGGSTFIKRTIFSFA